MSKRRVVITGMGAVSPLGHTVPKLWKGVRQAKCGIGEITLFDTIDHKVKMAGEVKDLPFENFIDRKALRSMDRFTSLALVAAAETMETSGIDFTHVDPNRFGVLLASGIGGLGSIEEAEQRGLAKGFDKVSPFFVPSSITNIAAAQVAIKYGFKGMCTCVVTACAAGTNAIGDAFRQIRDGYLDGMICGGTEASITPLGIGGFTIMKALNESNDPNRGSIPFDKERSGFVMGEGAGLLMLEELEHAQKRGATIYGELVGYGSVCDAYHITSPAPEGEGGARAMQAALDDAKLTATDIDYINAHGTSTPLNDARETSAIKTVFGPHAYELKVSSSKSMIGHLLGASGAVEAIISTMALQEGYIPPTINYQVPDEECDLHIVPNVGIEQPIEYALSNSLGFGGHNATIIIKKWNEQ